MPSSFALCDVDDVRGFLQKQTADTNQDQVVDGLIDAASRHIQNRYGKFAPQEDAAEKDFTFTGGNRLDLFPYFARDVTDVSFDSYSSTPSVLTASDYEWQLRPQNPLDGVYRWLRLPYSRLNGLLEVNVTVTGDWGFEEVPADVKQACVITVAEWIRKDVAAFSTTYSIDQDRLDVPAAIPRAAMMLLQPYGREGQG